MKSKEFNYQESYQKIEDIVKDLESGEMDVDELTEKVKEAISLINMCKKKLKQTESDIDTSLDKLNADE